MPIWCGIHFISISKQSRIELKSFKATHNFFLFYLTFPTHIDSIEKHFSIFALLFFSLFMLVSLYQFNDFLENNLIQVVQLFFQRCSYVSPIFFVVAIKANIFLSLNRYFIFLPSQFTFFLSLAAQIKQITVFQRRKLFHGKIAI